MIRFGIIGTNWITDSFLQAAQEADGFALTAVYSRTAQRAQEFSDKYGAARVYTNIEEMAASGEIDAVYIASPNSLHAEHAKACMKHGVHVLCEKPIASNSAELKEMVAVAREHGVVLMEAMKSTLQPNFGAVRDNLHRIGKVRRYVSSFCQYSSRYDAYKQGTVLNAFNPSFSNGALMDLGIYCLYPLVVLFGKPDRIHANAVMLGSGVDGGGSLLLAYPEMEAVIHYSKMTNSSLPSEIQGEDGVMTIAKISMLESVEIRGRDGSLTDVTREQEANTMVYEVNEFIGLIRQGRTESAINSHDHSLWTMEIMDEARKQIGLVYPADAKYR
ncbi:Gfo/Idh/MocA family protein [Paenibacillus hodogayensis]|uniref:Gfo/Idh/MocA family protein n=1 Tax=Paenibacillus hodogayensis TaxID=279208 RepID=A0ABV5W0J3_9BACL